VEQTRREWFGMSIWSQAIPYFPVKELACRCCGVVKLDIRMAVMLPALRKSWGKTLTPTSVCRCPKRNVAVGGHPRSLHLTENAFWATNGSGAADIFWDDWPMFVKLQFARMAHEHGFRVGLHNNFCHIDIGRELGISARPFLYGTWSGQFTAEDVL
jgi:hypothetical protein